MGRHNKSGRPKGAKTQPPNIQQVPLPRCPRCNSTKLERIKTLVERPLHGHGPDQLPHTSITWKRCKCHQCQCLVTVQHYHLDTSLWIGDQDPRQFTD